MTLPTVDVRWTLTDSNIAEALRRLNLAGQNMAGPFRDIARSLKTSTQMRFRTQIDPSGHRWTPAKRTFPTTRKRIQGGQTLSLTGRLRNSITSSSDADSATVGTNVVYGKYHQRGHFGPESVRAYKRRVTVVFGRRLRKPVEAKVGPFTRQGRLPRREFLGLSNDDRDEILHIVNDYFRALRPGI